jgi:hypothetical protein
MSLQVLHLNFEFAAKCLSQHQNVFVSRQKPHTAPHRYPSSVTARLSPSRMQRAKCRRQARRFGPCFALSSQRHSQRAEN